MRQAQKMEAIGRLAGGIAHDFNNMLTAIHGNVSMLAMGGLSPQEERGATTDAIRAVERATTLTRGQLLTFSRREPLELHTVEMNEIVAEMAKMLQRLIGEQITLQASFLPAGRPHSGRPRNVGASPDELWPSIPATPCPGVAPLNCAPSAFRWVKAPAKREGCRGGLSA